MCEISKNYKNRKCANLKSGLKYVYIANYIGAADESGFVLSSTPTGHTITDLGDLGVVYRYELKLDSTVNDLQFGESTRQNDNDVTTWEPSLTIQLNGTSAEQQYQMKMLALGTPYIFVENRAGDIVLLGAEVGCKVSIAGGFGTGMDGHNGYVITATAMDYEPPYFLDKDTIDALKSIVYDETAE